MTYLRNYAVLNVKDRLARIEGVGQVLLFGSGDYSMRVWLDPRKVAERGLSASDVVRAIREQNVQAAAGQSWAARPAPRRSTCSSRSTRRGVSQSEEEFGDIIVKSDAGGAVTRLRDVARIELGASEYALRSLLDNKPAVAVPIFAAPELQRDPDLGQRARAPWPRSRRSCPRAWTTRSSTTRHSSCAPRSRPWCERCSRRPRWSCWW